VGDLAPVGSNDNGDHVEPNLHPADRVLGEPLSSEPAQSGLLAETHGLGRRSPHVSSPGLDLAEDENPPPPYDQVDLPVSAAIVALHEVESEPSEDGFGQVLASKVVRGYDGKLGGG
jgi:hypothetical protein